MIVERVAWSRATAAASRATQSRQADRIPAIVDCTDRVARSRRNERRRKLKSHRSRAISSRRRRQGTGCPASAAVRPRLRARAGERFPGARRSHRRGRKDRSASTADGEVVQPEVDAVERGHDARCSTHARPWTVSTRMPSRHARRRDGGTVRHPALDHREEQPASPGRNRRLHFALRVRPRAVHTAPRLHAGQRRDGRKIRRGAGPDFRVEAGLPYVLPEPFPIHEERADAAPDQRADTLDVVIEHDQLDCCGGDDDAWCHARVAHATMEEPNGRLKRLDVVTSIRLMIPSVRSRSRPGRRSTGCVPPASRRLRYTSGNSRHWFTCARHTATRCDAVPDRGASNAGAGARRAHPSHSRAPERRRRQKSCPPGLTSR